MDDPPGRFTYVGVAIALAALFITAFAVSAESKPASAATGTMSGVVACTGGRGVVGVWVESSGGGSGWASFSPRSGANWVATYSKSVTVPSNVRLHIGCGGSASSWWSTNLTPTWSITGSKSQSAACAEASGAKAQRCTGWGATVFVGMPFVGYWDRFNLSHPRSHPIYGGAAYHWGTDLYAAPGTAVYPKVFAPAALNASLKWEGTWSGCAGTGVKVGVYSGATRIGGVSYAHLDAVPSIAVGTPISTTTRIGSLKLWPWCTGKWEVRNADGVHTHIEVGSKSGYACYIQMPSIGPWPNSNAIGKLNGGGATGPKQRCP